MPRKKATQASEPPQILSFNDAKKAQVLAENAAALAELAAATLIAAESIGIKTKKLQKLHAVTG